LSMAALVRFSVLFTVLYAAFGVQSPYLPALLSTRGLPPEQIGLVLAAATLVKLLTGPAIGRLADMLAARKAVFGVCALIAAVLAVGYLQAEGLGALLVIATLQGAVLAPLAPLADALALASAGPRRAFEYGWVRGAGSAAFILGSVASGQAVAQL